jgi:serine/threonine protein kinase
MTAQIPGYRIVKTLGKGGMATVHLAVQEIFEREVALKIMSKALTADSAFGQRFMREAQIVSKLIHPNIVTVYDVGLSEGSYYLSMEYIDGEDLKHVRKKLTFMEKIRAVKDIASALDVSGNKGYVHRDIKPENIMIERSSKRAVLMDFGIARASEVDINVTQAGTAIGTPHYMSPEQAKGNDVDPRADLYSLGVVLFYLLAGYVPFEGDSAVSIGIRHITEPVPELPPYVREMQWFIDKAMAKNPDDRFQSGAEFSESLDSLDLAFIAKQIESHEIGANTSDFDTPTIVSEQAINTNGAHHQYGEKLRAHEREDFTLNFETQEPPTLDLKWPIYAAGGGITLLAAVGIYLFASYEPAPLNADSEIVKSTKAQNAIAQLVLGKRQKLSPEDQTKFNDLNQQIDQALAVYRNNASVRNLTELVELHRQLLLIVPSDQSTQERLGLLADEQIALLEPEFNDGNFKQAQRILANVLELFPGHSSPALDHARRLMTMRSKVEKLMDDGNRYFKKRDYIEPPNDNAVASYQAALAIAPNLKPAHDGLERTAKVLVNNAQSALSNGDLQRARNFVNQALTALPSYLPALTIERELLSSASIAEKIESLFDQAQRYMASGNLYSPVGANAFETYRSILALDTDNNLALERQRTLVKQLQSHAEQLVAKSNYSDASALLDEASRNFPDELEIRDLAKAIQQKILDHRYQHTSRIGTIRASGLPKVPLDRNQPRSIEVDDKLFFRFDYHNFSPDNVIVVVNLYNATSNLPLASKQLHLKGPDGDTEFVFDLGRGGNTSGGYRMDIVVDGKVIGQLSFRID